MKSAIVKFRQSKWAGEFGWIATLSVDGDEYARVQGRDYMQVAVAIQGYVMSLAPEAGTEDANS